MLQSLGVLLFLVSQFAFTTLSLVLNLRFKSTGQTRKFMQSPASIYWMKFRTKSGSTILEIPQKMFFYLNTRRVRFGYSSFVGAFLPCVFLFCVFLANHCRIRLPAVKRRRRGIFVVSVPRESQAPSGATSSVCGRNMSLLTELENILDFSTEIPRLRRWLKSPPPVFIPTPAEHPARRGGRG